MSEEMKLLEAQLRDQEKAAKSTREKLDRLRKADEAERLKPLRETTERAHDLLCPYNHTDGCSWGYEADNEDAWFCDAHSRWLRNIDRLVNGGVYDKAITNLAQINIVLDAIEEIKPKVPTAMALLRGKLTP